MATPGSALEILARYVPPKLVAWTAVIAVLAAVALVGTLILSIVLGFEFKLAGLVFGRNPISPILPGAGLPSGAVVAFDENDGCPSPGWQIFDAAMGRVIIGADPPNWRGSRQLDENNIPLSPRAWNDTGGEEKHALKVEELAPHTHNITLTRRWGQHPGAVGWGGDDGQGEEASLKTDSAGLSIPHNNMPPYIALIYCKQL